MCSQISIFFKFHCVREHSESEKNSLVHQIWFSGLNWTISKSRILFLSLVSLVYMVRSLFLHNFQSISFLINRFFCMLSECSVLFFHMTKDFVFLHIVFILFCCILSIFNIVGLRPPLIKVLFLFSNIFFSNYVNVVLFAILFICLFKLDGVAFSF